MQAKLKTTVLEAVIVKYISIAFSLIHNFLIFSK